MILFAEAGVDDDGDGAVVDEAHLHVGAEHTSLHLLPHHFRELGAVEFI